MTPPDGKLDDEKALHAASSDEAVSGLARSDDAKDAEASNSVALSDTTGTAGIEPFLAAAAAKGAKTAREAAETPPPRSLKGLLLDYSAHAAMIVGLIGFAWTVSDHVVARPIAASIEAPGAPAPKLAKQADAGLKTDAAGIAEPAAAKTDDMAELRAANQRLSDEVGTLHVEVGTLHAALDRTPEQVRALTSELERTKTALVATKSETTAALAQLSGRIDKVQHDPNSKMQQLVDKLAKLERESVDSGPTGSIAPSQAAQGKALPLPLPPLKPAPAKLASTTDDGRKAAADRPADEGPQKPQVLVGWVVRDVYDGVALVEGRHGQIEVVPGVSIPGAGVVKSIDRHGTGWTVTTSKGLLAAAAPQQRGQRRGYAREGYPAGPYDF